MSPATTLFPSLSRRPCRAATDASFVRRQRRRCGVSVPTTGMPAFQRQLSR